MYGRRVKRTKERQKDEGGEEQPRTVMSIY